MEWESGVLPSVCHHTSGAGGQIGVSKRTLTSCISTGASTGFTHWLYSVMSGDYIWHAHCKLYGSVSEGSIEPAANNGNSFRRGTDLENSYSECLTIILHLSSQLSSEHMSGSWMCFKPSREESLHLGKHYCNCVSLFMRGNVDHFSLMDAQVIS